MISHRTHRPTGARRLPGIAATILRRTACIVAALAVLALSAAQADARRLALVVGNAAYQTIPALDNAVTDARDMAEALRRLGFEVTLLTDVGSDTFWVMLDTFSKQTETAESALFFYSGHAFQIDGVNHLAPVSARLSDPESLKAETWNLDGIVARLQSRNSQTLIFLDACRTNPLPPGVRSTGTDDDGLAQFQTRAGTFVAFATEPGAVSYDGTGSDANSPFTRALLDHIETPGISISDLMIRVRNDVETRTDSRQTPWDQSSLRTQFYFNPGAGDAPAVAAALPQFDLVDDILEIGAPDHGRGDPVARVRLDPVPQNGDTARAQALSGPVAGLPPIQRIEALPDLDLARSGGADAGGELRLAALSSETRSVPAMTGLSVGAEGRARIAGVDAAPERGEAAGVAAGTEAGAGDDEAVAGAEEAAEPDDTRIAAIRPDEIPAVERPGDTPPDIGALPDILEPEAEAEAEAEPELEGRELASAVQTELQRMGCYRMRVDGIWGNGSRNALRGYYREKQTEPDELEPTLALYRELQDETDVTCPAPRVAAPVRTAPQATTGSGQRQQQPQRSTGGYGGQQQQAPAATTTTRQRECTFMIVAIVCR